MGKAVLQSLRWKDPGELGEVCFQEDTRVFSCGDMKARQSTPCAAHSPPALHSCLLCSYSPPLLSVVGWALPASSLRNLILFPGVPENLQGPTLQSLAPSETDLHQARLAELCLCCVSTVLPCQTPRPCHYLSLPHSKSLSFTLSSNLIITTNLGLRTGVLGRS